VTACMRLHNVSLVVPTWLQPECDNRSWRTMLLRAAFDPPRRKLHRLLDDISFKAHEGDRIGLLGINGSGKSTLLRVLNGVYVPTSGSITVTGSRQALLNLSLGLSNEATVVENIFLRGTAMGMKTALIRNLTDSILAFSGLEAKASHRLHTLSSGQRMRLGFAISTSTQHDIMLMDEWVGTGDAEFVAKAKERLLDRVSGSKIMVLASHSQDLLRNICNRGLVLDDGQLVFDGTILDALKAYHEIVMRVQSEREAKGRQVQTTGALDGVVLEPAGKLRLRGWALQGFTTMPTLLVFDIAGERRVMADFKRIERKDVQRHFGLSDPVCGFEVELDVSDLEGWALSPPQIYGGSQADDLDGPFKVGAAVMTRWKEFASRA